MNTDFQLYFNLASGQLSRLKRKSGMGTQFRHQVATFAVLLEYGFSYDSVLLKSALLHDVLEDGMLQENDFAALLSTDREGTEVYRLVREVSIRMNEKKEDYLNRIMQHQSSDRAKILKLADRIANLCELAYYTLDKAFIHRYLLETQQCILPFAQAIHQEMAAELHALVELTLNSLQNKDI